MVRGFWGDIVNSPYIAFGIELDQTEEDEYFKKKNQHIYMFNSELISEYNLNKIFFGFDYKYLSYKKKVNENRKNDKNEKNENNTNEPTEIMVLDHSNLIYSLGNLFERMSENIKFKIRLLSGSSVDKIIQKKKWKNYFDFIVYSFNNSIKAFSDIRESIKDSGKVWVEMPM